MSFAWVFAAVLVSRSAVAAPAERESEWRETTTPHFRIHHQDVWLPAGMTIGLERIHFRLGMDLGQFSPWMARERIGLYLYRDLDSYVRGRFGPPSWSNGVAIYDQRAVAVPAARQTPQLLRVLAHEITHLLFVGYFREARRDPPSWINEGLAMLEEADSPQRPETSVWYQRMAEADPRGWVPMEKFLAIRPTKDLHDDRAMVAIWYVQAYSVTHFLLRRHTRLQFKSFCAALRDGKTSQEALRGVYHYRSVADFEKRWRDWLADPAHRRRVAALAASALVQDEGVVKTAGENTPFHPFSLEKR